MLMFSLFSLIVYASDGQKRDSDLLKDVNIVNLYTWKANAKDGANAFILSPPVYE